MIRTRLAARAPERAQLPFALPLDEALDQLLVAALLSPAG